MKKVSVILPTYNESDNILGLIHEIIDNFPINLDYEIIVVDDNSPDNTFDRVQKESLINCKISAFKRTADRGLAKSIRYGIERATGDQIVIMDTDFTHDPREIPKMLHVGKIYDIVIASRFSPGGQMEDTGHYISSLFYNWWLRIILTTQIQDNLGGYFTIQKQKLELLPSDIIFHGYGDYFFRLLFYAERERFSIVEIPALYLSRKKGASKSNYLKMLYNYTKSAIRLKIKPEITRISRPK